MPRRLSPRGPITGAVVLGALGAFLAVLAVFAAPASMMSLGALWGISEAVAAPSKGASGKSAPSGGAESGKSGTGGAQPGLREDNLRDRATVRLKRVPKTIVLRGPLTEATADAIADIDHLTVWLDPPGFVPRSSVEAAAFVPARHLVSWPVTPWTPGHMNRMENMAEYVVAFDLRDPAALTDQLLDLQNRTFTTLEKLLRVSPATLRLPKAAEKLARFKVYTLEIDMSTPDAKIASAFTHRVLATVAKNFVFKGAPTQAQADAVKSLKHVRVTADLTGESGEGLKNALRRFAALKVASRGVIVQGPFFEEMAGLISALPKLGELRIVLDGKNPPPPAFVDILNR